MFTKRYRLIDIARQIDRDKSTIIRWEELGLIPVAERDSRGWRFYSEEQVQSIVKRVKETDYFRKSSDANGKTMLKPAHRVVYI